MRRLFALFVVLAVAAVACGSVAGADATFGATQDTYVSSAFPNANNGAATTLRAGAGPTRRSFLQFNVTSTVSTATLDVTVVSGSGNLAVDAVADNSWTGSMTYAEQPALGAQLASVGSAKGTVSFNVTSDVTGGVVSFALTSTGGLVLDSSRASKGQPALDVTPAGTPSPSPTASPTPTGSPSPTASPTPTPTVTPTPTASPPPGQPHVLVVMEENKGYAATLGTCSADPYFCSLAAKYTSFTNSHGVTHPSDPNYIAFDSGSTQGCTSDGCFGPYKVTSLGGQLNTAGIPWKAYMETMPSACFTGSTSGAYARKHNPFIDFTDAVSPCNDIPYPGVSSMLSTLDGANPPDFVWITPNLNDDMHDGTVQQGDAWLKTNLAPVLSSPWFADFNSTVIVTMDEGDAGSTNQIPTVVISNNALAGGGVPTNINHYAVLRAIETVFGLGFLGGASTAPDISRYFG